MNPSCFISYSWDSDEHKIWVRSLAEQLQYNGVKTLLDQWDVKPGVDVPGFMETSIRESQFVLLICTPNFAAKANAGKGGVGYEKQIVTGEMFALAAPETKFVPLLRAGNESTALPSYLFAKMFIDFRRKDIYESGFEILLRHLHNSPTSVRPPLGEKPEFGHSDLPAPKPSNINKEFDLSTFQSFYEYAYSANGLNLTRDEAITWAQDKVDWNGPFDLARFKTYYKYAYGSDGLNLNRLDAVVWADDKMKTPTFDLDQFKRLFAYAYGSSGLNLSRDQAIAWVEQKLHKTPDGS